MLAYPRADWKSVTESCDGRTQVGQRPDSGGHIAETIVARSTTVKSGSRSLLDRINSLINYCVSFK